MIIITGATGLLGSTLYPQLKSQGRSVRTQSYKNTADFTADLSVPIQAFELLSNVKPRVIVNLVGLTSVERCQDHPQEAYLLNTKVVENIVKWMLESDSDCHLVQISTDQVYDGSGPHNEDQVTITNNYAFSKYAGELAAALVPSTILRTNFVGLSKAIHRESLTDWVFNSLNVSKQISVLQDVFFSPLSLKFLAEMISIVIDKKPIGVFNLGSRNGMTKADFDYVFAEHLGLPVTLMSRINSDQATFLRAYRPKDMRMNSFKFESALGVSLPCLIDQIKVVAEEYNELR
jgi:dTDP-4-dehydrorhamnose reductase